jgi:hypothetical protein
VSETAPEVYAEIIMPEREHGLGRHVEHDERSRGFDIQTFLAQRSVTIRSVEWTRRSPIFDQGQLGSCTGNAIVGAMATDSLQRKGSSNLTESDALDAYHWATVYDVFPGTYTPTDTGSSGNAAAKAARHLGMIQGYRWAFSIKSALQALMSGPFITGIAWREDMFYPDSHGVVRWTGAVAGGHEFCAVGYDSNKEIIKFANSWGTEWGANGYFFMPVTEFERALKARGDVTIPVF